MFLSFSLFHFSGVKKCVWISSVCFPPCVSASDEVSYLRCRWSSLYHFPLCLNIDGVLTYQKTIIDRHMVFTMSWLISDVTGRFQPVKLSGWITVSKGKKTKKKPNINHNMSIKDEDLSEVFAHNHNRRLFHCAFPLLLCLNYYYKSAVTWTGHIPLFPVSRQWLDTGINNHTGDTGLKATLVFAFGGILWIILFFLMVTEEVETTSIGQVRRCAE